MTTAVAGFVTAVLVSAPFGLTVIGLTGAAPFVESSLLQLVTKTAAVYPYLSVNAYNIWALFPVDGTSMASGGGWLFDSAAPDATSWGAFGPIPAALVGAAGLLTVTALAVLAAARKPDRLTILVATCVVAFAFFAVPTRVHERYLFPLFALAAILFAFSWRWRIAYVIASVATFLNMYVVLTTLYGDMNPKVSDWLGIGEGIRSPFGVTLVALLHTGAFVWVLAQLLPRARRALAAELAAGRWHSAVAAPGEVSAPVLSPEPAPVSASPSPGAGGVVMATAVATSGDRPESSGPRALPPRRRARLAPAWFDRPSWTELGPLAWFRARLAETPIRPDRSAMLRHERPGRLDRLDLWLLIVLMVAAMGLRMFRLAEPARMHFDEVYHARTATEFLQQWRYGISHSIYEWTHPHLAKYLMAGGITLFAGHDVDASSDLGVPVRDAAIEPRREDAAGGSDRAGDRVWVTTGTELIAYDLATRKEAARWPIPGASAVAYDEAGQQILVGTDAGDVLAVYTPTLDEDRAADPADPVAEVLPVGTLDGPVTRLASFDDGSHVAVVLDGGTIAVMDLATGEETGRITVDGATDLGAIGDTDGIVVTPSEVTDAAAAAATLEAALGGDAAAYEEQLRRTDADTLVLDALLTPEARTAIQAAIDDGTLAGVAIGPVRTMAVAGSEGVTLLSPQATPAGIRGSRGPRNGPGPREGH